jgi:SWI/SNF chromatin-remodeling complex subunit SWI1
MDRDDLMPFARITHRGMNVLRILAQKAEEMTDEGSRLPLGVLPKKESLLGALLTVHIDGTIVKELCSYAGLDD